MTPTVRSEGLPAIPVAFSMNLCSLFGCTFALSLWEEDQDQAGHSQCWSNKHGLVLSPAQGEVCVSGEGWAGLRQTSFCTPKPQLHEKTFLNYIMLILSKNLKNGSSSSGKHLWATNHPSRHPHARQGLWEDPGSISSQVSPPSKPHRAGCWGETHDLRPFHELRVPNRAIPKRLVTLEPDMPTRTPGHPPSKSPSYQHIKSFRLQTQAYFF